MFPLASGAKEVKQVLKPGTIIWLLLHSLKVKQAFHQSAERDGNPCTAWLSANQMWEVSTLQLGHWA